VLRAEQAGRGAEVLVPRARGSVTPIFAHNASVSEKTRAHSPCLSRNAH
jgi:hypothetical protein